MAVSVVLFLLNKKETRCSAIAETALQGALVLVISGVKAPFQTSVRLERDIVCCSVHKMN